MNCHEEYQRPDVKTADGFNTWAAGPKEQFRLRHDDTMSIMCEACHGATHAVYPSRNKLGPDLDNIQSLQYQQNRFPIGYQRCSVCHTVPMDEPIHHGMAETALIQEE